MRLELRAAAAWALIPFSGAASAATTITAADVTGLPSDRRSIATVDTPAIDYHGTADPDAAAQLARQIENGRVSLEFNRDTGYLPAILRALHLDEASQMLVFSKTSVQQSRINPDNPRALYFNDNVAVGYIRGAPFLEIAALDPRRGMIFYTVNQVPEKHRKPVREPFCLGCHVSLDAMDVAGMLLRSIPTDRKGITHPVLGNYVVDHRTPFDDRWGGWYVTGALSGARDMGNAFVPDTGEAGPLIDSRTLSMASLSHEFDTQGYLTPYSDIAAQLVFDHQVHMTNLLIRVGWDARSALASAAEHPETRNLVRQLLRNDARELVDYLLFVDEAKLPGPVKTSTTFASDFARLGPVDPQGRSLRQLDLRTRLMRYPCSYMIYSKAFDDLPSEAKQAIYARMWEVLSGKDEDPRYEKITKSDRRAVIEILRSTKPDLPKYFR